jgi:hypothetical protein
MGIIFENHTLPCTGSDLAPSTNLGAAVFSSNSMASSNTPVLHVGALFAQFQHCQPDLGVCDFASITIRVSVDNVNSTVSLLLDKPNVPFLDEYDVSRRREEIGHDIIAVRAERRGLLTHARSTAASSLRNLRSNRVFFAQASLRD